MKGPSPVPPFSGSSFLLSNAHGPSYHHHTTATTTTTATTKLGQTGPQGRPVHGDFLTTLRSQLPAPSLQQTPSPNPPPTLPPTPTIPGACQCSRGSLRTYFKDPQCSWSVAFGSQAPWISLISHLGQLGSVSRSSEIGQAVLWEIRV